MSVFLLLLGAVMSVAGLALVASGGMVRDGAFDAEVITPGTVAAVGGLVLVGLGLVVRELQRIERVLAARPMPRPSRPVEAAVAAMAAERPAGPVRGPLPPQPKAESAAQAAPPAPTRTLPERPDAAFERLRDKFPTSVRLENAPVVEESDISLLPQPSARAEEVLSADKNGNVAVPAGGAATNGAAPQLEVKARPPGARRQPKGSVFDAFWPKMQRRGRDAEPLSAHGAASRPSPAVEPAPGAEAAPLIQPAAGAQPPGTSDSAVAPVTLAPAVSILKSGVVEGMAYTLYSDGSIEAQFPQGLLRFGSIAELRRHLENSP